MPTATPSTHAYNHLIGNIPNLNATTMANHIITIIILKLGEIATIQELTDLTNEFTLQTVVDVITDLNATGRFKAILEASPELGNLSAAMGGNLSYTNDVLDETQLIKILKVFIAKYYLLQNDYTSTDSLLTVLNCTFIDSVGATLTDVPVKFFKSTYDLAEFFVSLDLNIDVFISILEKQTNMQCVANAVPTLTEDLVLYMKLVILTKSTNQVRINYFALVKEAVIRESSSNLISIGVTEAQTINVNTDPYVLALRYLMTKSNIIGDGTVLFNCNLFTWRTYINESILIQSNSVLNNYVLLPNLITDIFTFINTQSVNYNAELTATFTATSLSLIIGYNNSLSMNIHNVTYEYIVTCYVCSKINDSTISASLLTLISAQTLDINSLIYFNVYFPTALRTLSIDTLLSPTLNVVNTSTVASELWLTYIADKVNNEAGLYTENCNLAQQIFNYCMTHLPQTQITRFIHDINTLSNTLHFNVPSPSYLFYVDSFLQTKEIMNKIHLLLQEKYPLNITHLNTSYDYLINNLLVNSDSLLSKIRSLYYCNAATGFMVVKSMLNSPIISDIIYNIDLSRYTTNTMNLSENTIAIIRQHTTVGFGYKYITEVILNPSLTIGWAATNIKAWVNDVAVLGDTFTNLSQMVSSKDQNNNGLTNDQIVTILLAAVYANVTDAIQPSSLFLYDIKTILSGNSIVQSLLRSIILVRNITAGTVLSAIFPARNEPALNTANVIYTAFMKNLIFNSVKAVQSLVTTLFINQNRAMYLNEVMKTDNDLLHLTHYYNQYIILEAQDSFAINGNFLTKLISFFPTPTRRVLVLENDETGIACNSLWVLALAYLTSTSSVLAEALLNKFGGKVLFSYKYVTYLVSQEGNLTRQETLVFNPVHFSPFNVNFNLGLEYNNLNYNNLITSRAPFEITANAANNVATYYADATKGVNVAGGWQFTSALAQDRTKNTKINWYMYQPMTDMVITDLTNNPTNTYYTIVDNVGVEFPMIYIYTKPTVPATKTSGGIMGSSWYQSKFVYQANQAGTVGTYLLYVGADPTTIRPDLTHINLRQLDTLCMGTLQPNEIVMWAALMTSSNLDSPVGNFSFTMSKFGVVIADLQDKLQAQQALQTQQDLLAQQALQTQQDLLAQ